MTSVLPTTPQCPPIVAFEICAYLTNNENKFTQFPDVVALWLVATLSSGILGSNVVCKCIFWKFYGHVEQVDRRINKASPDVIGDHDVILYIIATRTS